MYGPAKSFNSEVKESDCPPALERVLTNKLPKILEQGSDVSSLLSSPKAVKSIATSTNCFTKKSSVNAPFCPSNVPQGAARVGPSILTRPKT